MGIFAEPAASGTPRGRFEAKRELTVAPQCLCSVTQTPARERVCHLAPNAPACEWNLDIAASAVSRASASCSDDPLLRPRVEICAYMWSLYTEQLTKHRHAHVVEARVCVLLLPACIHVSDAAQLDTRVAQLDVTIIHRFVLRHVFGG
jgi:hypothetical protein